MPSSEKSLVMGFVAGLPVDLVRPFFSSLRETGYAGRVCLFVSRTSAANVKKLQLLADEVIDVDPLYNGTVTGLDAKVISLLLWVRMTRRIRRIYPTLFRLIAHCWGSTANRHQRRLYLEWRMEGLQSLRYMHYSEYLKRTDPDYVLISDVRDVYFQQDPFGLHVPELEVALEANHVTIGGESFNSRWMSNLYGRDVLRQIAKFTISCSGTTLGTAAGMRRYLHLMTDEVIRHRRPLGSHDQGIHNYLLRSGYLEPVVMRDNEAGRVITLGMQKILRLNGNGQVVNGDSSLPAIVHQYDRHATLSAEILRRSQSRMDSALKPA